MRIAIVQFGVYHEAYLSFRQGGPETYYAQRYSVDFVEDLSKSAAFVGIIGVVGDEAVERELTPSLSSACIPAVGGMVDAPAAIRTLEKWRPDRLILQAPSLALLKWALAKGIDCLPLFADSFEFGSVRQKITSFRLKRLLNDPAIRAVGNHNIPSCLSLKRIGVDPAKIYPWDWPHALRPEDNPVKTLPEGPANIVFVGSIAETKGARDCINAAKLLQDQGLDFRMTLIGAGEYAESANALVRELGLEDRVTLAGRKSHDEVVEALKGATISLAPSHHKYPEGLPMTIYEALATRTPLALSDHPMFRMYFSATPAARMTPEKNPQALGEAIAALLSDPETYRAASAATEALWNRVKCDLAWGDLLSAWLDERPDGLERIRDFSLDRALAKLPTQ